MKTAGAYNELATPFIRKLDQYPGLGHNSAAQEVHGSAARIS
jgi:hypothetical protein